ELAQTIEGHTDAVYRVTFNPTGTHLLSCGHAGSLHVWNLADGKSLLTNTLPSVAYSASYSSDGKRIIASCANGSAYFVEVPEAAQ
ncbi:MAG: hypothetical protein IH991_09735, partial [Planctomycetes bacterium]|nr:hypothetical protein [Planctomycetota bacterium]